MKIRYNEDVEVRFLSSKRKSFLRFLLPRTIKMELVKDLWIRSDWLISGKRIAFIISTPFKYDGASVPSFLWWYVSPIDENIRVASAGHDFLTKKKGKVFLYIFENNEWKEYKEVKFTRLQADLLLYEKMKSFGAGFLKRFVVFLGVRMAGWIWFYKVDEKLKKIFTVIIK